MAAICYSNPAVTSIDYYYCLCIYLKSILELEINIVYNQYYGLAM